MWAGQNGHGKTDLTIQTALSLLGQNERVCVASFEMKPVTTIGRMVRMFAMTNPFSPEYQADDGMVVLDTLYDDFGQWTTGKLWLYETRPAQRGQALCWGWSSTALKSSALRTYLLIA